MNVKFMHNDIKFYKLLLNIMYQIILDASPSKILLNVKYKF